VHFGATRFRQLFTAGLLCCLATIGRALTLEELQSDATLAPGTVARRFADFKYRFHAEVQVPQVFLSKRSGDCDDYATLAADLLKARGFAPRLISVRMKKVVHVVCYVEDVGGYLDYNKRTCADGLVRSGNTLAEIADKVAASFGTTWASVSEFTYRDGMKRLVQTSFPPEPAKHKGFTQSERTNQPGSS